MNALSRLLARFTFLRWLALLGLFHGMANAATVQTIGPISFTPTTLAAGLTTTASATASSGLAVSFSSTTLSICTVSGNIVTGVAAGTCTIAANQAGNGSYAAAAQVTQTIAVKASQTIGAISFMPSSLAVGGTTTASATGGASGNPVTFSSTSTGICTVTSGGLVTGIGFGNCVVVANQLGSTTYADATPVTQSIAVAKGSQTISAISFSPTSLAIGGTTTASATASSGLPVSFSSASPAICTVSGNTVTGVAIGTCSIVANQAGNANFSAAPPLGQNIIVGQGSQTISAISFSPTFLAVGGVTWVGVTASSGLAVSLSSSVTPTICSVSGNTVTGLLAGICTITASQTGNANYLAATPVTQNINVKKGQTIGVIGFSPTNLAVGGITAATAAASSGLAVSFSSTTPTICDVTSDGTVTGKTVGTCTIAANQAGDTTWAPATQVAANITVAKGPQTIGAITLSVVLRAGGTSTAQATASSFLPVSFSSASPATCTVSGSTVTGVAIGTCSILANQAGDANYMPATPVVGSMIVGQGSQTISTISFMPTSLAAGGTTTASATASSGLAVSFSSASPAICTVSGSTVTGVAIGTCSIVANQAGNASYLAAQIVVKNITVGLANQTIGPITFTRTTLNVGATAVASASATSGLPVSFSSSVTPTICSVSGTNGTVVAGDTLGTCTITASQDGFQNGIQNYNAAPSVQKDILVTGTTVSFNPSALTFDPQYVGTTSATKTLTLTNTGGGRLNITSILSTVNVFAVSGNTCGNSVLAGAFCTISVTFSPAATGTRVGSIRMTSNSANGTDSFTVSGQGVASNAPICTLSASPASVSRGRSSTLTANCSPMPTSYSWTGGTCASTSAATCTVKPTLTTAYGVTGTNSFGSSTGSATVTVKPVDLTPILMLLLD